MTDHPSAANGPPEGSSAELDRRITGALQRRFEPSSAAIERVFDPPGAVATGPAPGWSGSRRLLVAAAAVVLIVLSVRAVIETATERLTERTPGRGDDGGSPARRIVGGCLRGCRGAGLSRSVLLRSRQRHGHLVSIGVRLGGGPHRRQSNRDLWLLLGWLNRWRCRPPRAGRRPLDGRVCGSVRGCAQGQASSAARDHDPSTADGPN